MPRFEPLLIRLEPPGLGVAPAEAEKASVPEA
jgi:hypothetical protein